MNRWLNPCTKHKTNWCWLYWILIWWRCVLFSVSVGGGRYEDSYPMCNTQGVMHKRSVLQTVVSPIPDLRSSLDDTTAPQAFQGKIFFKCLCTPAFYFYLFCTTFFILHILKNFLHAFFH